MFKALCDLIPPILLLLAPLVNDDILLFMNHIQSMSHLYSSLSWTKSVDCPVRSVSSVHLPMFGLWQYHDNLQSDLSASIHPFSKASISLLEWISYCDGDLLTHSSSQKLQKLPTTSSMNPNSFNMMMMKTLHRWTPIYPSGLTQLLRSPKETTPEGPGHCLQICSGLLYPKRLIVLFPLSGIFSHSISSWQNAVHTQV